MSLKKALEKSKGCWAIGGLKFNILVKTDAISLLLVPFGLELSYSFISPEKYPLL